MKKHCRIAGSVLPHVGKQSWITIIGIAICLTLVQAANAQIIVGGPPMDKELTAKTQAAIVDSVSTALIDNYIFLDKAQAMEKLIRGNLKKGVYKDIKSYQEFTRRLTEDLRSVSHDLHLGIMYVPDQLIEEM